MEAMDSLAFGRHNQDFHTLIYERCPNATLVASLRDVARRLDAIRRTVFVQIPYRGSQSVAEHRELIRLIESARPRATSRPPPARTSSTRSSPSALGRGNASGGSAAPRRAAASASAPTYRLSPSSAATFALAARR